jgi:hypothetical protein
LSTFTEQDGRRLRELQETGQERDLTAPETEELTRLVDSWQQAYNEHEERKLARIRENQPTKEKGADARNEDASPNPPDQGSKPNTSEDEYSTRRTSTGSPRT